MEHSAGRTHLTSNDLNHSFIAFDQSMSPITDTVDRQSASRSKDSNEATLFDSNPPSYPSKDLSKEAYWISAPPALGRYPPSLMTNKNDIGGDMITSHIARPRNAFMIYRSECLANNTINRNVEHDNRHLSRIIGHCWQKLSKEDKAFWQGKADAEKKDHKNKYPNYKFSPVPRSKKPLKRNSKRNGEKDMERCRQVADLILSGKEGDELAAAIKQIDLEKVDDDDQQSPETSEPSHLYHSRIESYPPAFRNPLRPPRGPAPDLQPVNLSSGYYLNNYVSSQSLQEQHYPSPPESPTSLNFLFTENRTQNPYHLRPAYFSQTSSPLQVTRTHTRSYSSPVSPYQANRTYAQPMFYNSVQDNEQHGSHVAQNTDHLVDIRHSYTFLSPSLSSAFPPSPHTSDDNTYGNPK